MDPRAVLHPVGPLPARVYWMRRLAPVVVVAVLVLAVAVSCAGGSSPAVRAKTVTSPRPSASPTTPGGTLQPCGPAQLAVTASTDAVSYAAGTLPHFVVRVRNRSLHTCTFLDGPSVRTWSVFSGPDEVWTTAGCAVARTLVQRTLAPSHEFRHVLIWDRHRSGPQCATSTVSAAPGTYRLYARVGTNRSDAAVFHLAG